MTRTRPSDLLCCMCHHVETIFRRDPFPELCRSRQGEPHRSNHKKANKTKDPEMTRRTFPESSPAQYDNHAFAKTTAHLNFNIVRSHIVVLN